MMDRKPRIIKATNDLLSAGDLAEVIAVLKRGGLVAFPTETVYGLGVDGGNDVAIKVLERAKRRPPSSPFALQIGEIEQIYPLIEKMPSFVEPLLKVFWPGPLTIILPATDRVARLIKSANATVGLRFSSHPLAQLLPLQLGGPLAATSANLSGCPAPTTADEVLFGLAGKVDLLIDGGPCFLGVPSTLLDLSVTPPRILREGAIDQTSLETVLGMPLEKV